MTPLEILEIFLAAGILHVEMMIGAAVHLGESTFAVAQHLNQTHAESSSAAAQRLNRRMGHDHQPVYPGIGQLFLSCLNVLASVGSVGVWAFRVNKFSVVQSCFHLIYSLLTTYCATVEFFDITVGDYGHILFPIKLFPIVVAAGIFLLLVLESIWIYWRNRVHVPNPNPQTLDAPTGLDTYTVVIDDVAGHTNAEANNHATTSSTAAGTGLRRRVGASGPSTSGAGESSSSSSGYHTADNQELEHRELEH